MNTTVYPAELTLVDGTDTLVIRPANANAADGIVCSEWDIGAPEVRYTAVPRAGTDGTEEGAGYLGSRTVTLDLKILGGIDRADPAGTVRDAYWFADKLTAMCHPLRSPVLRISRAGGPTAGQVWSLALRANPWTVAYGRASAAYLSMQLTFTAPLGLLEGPLRGPFSTAQASGSEQTQWVFPTSFPMTFGAGDMTVPAISMDIEGSSPIGPVVYLIGPSVNPEVRTEDGERFRFDNLTLVAGQVVEINMDTGTIRLADTSSGVISDDPSVYQAVDFSVSTFWRWGRGTHVMRYYASSGSAAVQYRERRMSV